MLNTHVACCDASMRFDDVVKGSRVYFSNNMELLWRMQYLLAKPGSFGQLNAQGRDAASAAGVLVVVVFIFTIW